MEHLAFLVKNDENRVAEAGRIAQTLQQFGILLRFVFVRCHAWVVVHMDKDEVVVNHLADGTVFGHKIGEEQAPRAPIASQLADHELVGAFGLGYRIVNLFKGVDFFVVNPFNFGLCIC